MGIAELGHYLKPLNPEHGANPEGNCMNCARATALALTSGIPPMKAVNTSITYVSRQKEDPATMTFPRQQGRPALVWHWLTHAALPGVYAVDVDDHAYNFIVDANRTIYFIDSNQHKFGVITAPEQLVQTVYNDTFEEEDTAVFNYLDPGKRDIDFYYWGNLAARWQQVLAGTVVRERSASAAARIHTHIVSRR